MLHTIKVFADAPCYSTIMSSLTKQNSNPHPRYTFRLPTSDRSHNPVWDGWCHEITLGAQLPMHICFIQRLPQHHNLLHLKNQNQFILNSETNCNLIIGIPTAYGLRRHGGHVKIGLLCIQLYRAQVFLNSIIRILVPVVVSFYIIFFSNMYVLSMYIRH